MVRRELSERDEQEIREIKALADELFELFSEREMSNFVVFKALILCLAGVYHIGGSYSDAVGTPAQFGLRIMRETVGAIRGGVITDVDPDGPQATHPAPEGRQ